jgi:hypothetical protein
MLRLPLSEHLFVGKMMRFAKKISCSIKQMPRLHDGSVRERPIAAMFLPYVTSVEHFGESSQTVKKSCQQTLT